MSMSEDWTAIGHLSDIPRRGARCVTSPLGRIAVFRTMEDEVYATEDRCPHKGGPLSQGIVHGGHVTCPLHSQVISLRTGEVQGPDEGRVRTFPLRVDPLTGAIEILIAREAAFAPGAE
ncbi:tRNA-(guanine-N1)-methyltransferase [Aureimonas endophytica]|uniref:tRNA-(Guanine-N1)-methyltransferase n=2 Tax=Aureimonas endophytica TaxID=2027858 RepID=A0A917E392_9HYPH|nr:tRNA-(guanine-N1)-methyltransferase [Aureimonas endophytica]